MESQRSSKRRKLDTWQPEPPTTSVKHPSSSAPTTSKKSFLAARNKAPSAKPLVNGTTRNPAHDAWLEAKAKSLERRGKKLQSAPEEGRSIDVYDDIEGAYAHESPLKKTLPASSPLKKQQLDPLRNQKSTSTTSSPFKGVSSLGFFKQFHKPRVESEPDTPKENGSIGRLANGRGRDEVSSEQEDGERDSTSEDEATADGSTRESPMTPHVKGNWKGWTYE